VCAVATVHADYKKLQGTWIFPFLYASFRISDFAKERRRLVRDKKKVVHYKRFFLSEFFITGVYCISFTCYRVPVSTFPEQTV
jgi:hypothetical protein